MQTHMPRVSRSYKRVKSHEMAGWMANGQLKSKEDVVDGLETFPETLMTLFNGENFGKLVLKVVIDSLGDTSESKL